MRKLLFGLLAISILIGLYLASLYNFLLFHSIAEVFSIVIACGIFMVAWNTRHYNLDNYLVFIGIAYLFIPLMTVGRLSGPTTAHSRVPYWFFAISAHENRWKTSCGNSTIPLSSR